MDGGAEARTTTRPDRLTGGAVAHRHPRARMDQASVAFCLDGMRCGSLNRLETELAANVADGPHEWRSGERGEMRSAGVGDKRYRAPIYAAREHRENALGCSDASIGSPDPSCEGAECRDSSTSGARSGRPGSRRAVQQLHGSPGP